MSNKTKQELINQLSREHLELKEVLDGADLDKVIYSDSGWRVRDIVVHITTWDLEAVRSINAFNSGSEYRIMDSDADEIDYNERTVTEKRNLSNDQVMNEWEDVCEKFYRSVQDIPLELLSAEMLYPWGSERGDSITLVGYMVEHLEEHRDEIREVIGGNE